MKVQFQNFVQFSSMHNKSALNKQNEVSTNIPIGVDSVSFSGRYKANKIKVDLETAKFVADSLSTSTSGHRAKYGSDKFNPEVVELITLGVGKYAKDMAKTKGIKPVVMIGGDTRKATRESLPLIKDTLVKQGVDVLYINEPVPTPLLAYAAQEKGLDIAVLLTASHNPWEDGGYNLVTKEGAIAPPNVTKKVADNMVNYAKKGVYYSDSSKVGGVDKFNPYEIYKKGLDELNLINWETIKDSNIAIMYDALSGTGANTFPRLLKDYGIKCNEIKSGRKVGPNPTKENLTELHDAIIKSDSKLKVGLANDGDADRFGVVDENGEFITPNDVILLLGHHLANNKGISGEIIRSQATSSQLDLFAKNNNVGIMQTPVGFKYIAEDIIDLRKEGKDILVAGEESGGLTINGHIPEKDGIIALALILDLMATEKKPLSEILNDVKKGLGVEFRADLVSRDVANNSVKEAIMQRAYNVAEDAQKANTYKLSGFEVDSDRVSENMQLMEKYKKGGDGVKLYFKDGSSILFRKSGTESKVKAYIETYDDKANDADDKLNRLIDLANSFYEV